MIATMYYKDINGITIKNQKTLFKYFNFQKNKLLQILYLFELLEAIKNVY